MSRKTRFSRVPLGEFAKVVKREVNIEPTETYRTLGCRLYGQGVYQREIKKGIEIKAKRMFLVKENDFVINRIWAQKGSAGIVPPEISGSIVTPDFPVFALDYTKVLPSYIAWYLKTEDFWEECRRHSRGTSGRQRINPKEVPNISFPMCDLWEQRLIVARIERLMVRVEEARKLRAETVKEADALMNSALQDLDLSEFQVVSNEIGNCSSMKTGRTPQTHMSYYFGNDINWYCPSDLDFTKNGYLEFNSNRQISNLAVEDNKATVYEKDTILLVAIGGSIGKVAITKKECSSNQQITGIKFNEEIEPRYGYYWIRKLFSEIVSKASQATLPIINQQKIGSLKIKYPKDAQIQRHIVNYLDSLQVKVDELKKNQDETENEIEELIPSILDKAFKGES